MLDYFSKRWDLDMNFLGEYWYIIVIVIIAYMIIAGISKKR